MRPSIARPSNPHHHWNYDRTKRRDTTLFQTDSQLSLDSEKSYDPLFKKTELYEFITYLTFNLVWMFIAAFANVILFVLYTYEVVFDQDFSFYIPVLLTIIACDLIIIVDVSAAIIHMTWKHYAALKNLPPRSKALLIIDVVSVLWMIISFIPELQTTQEIAIIGILFILLRLYRVWYFFSVVSSTPGLGTFNILLQKYGVVIFIIVHIFSCVIQAMGCYKCDKNKKEWTSTVTDSQIYFGGETPGKWYIVCLYFILSTVSSVGFGDIHAVSDSEIFLMVLVMLFSFFLIVGAFSGAMTSVLLESYRRHSTFTTRLGLISKAMDHPKISKKLKAKIMNFYYMFWQQQKAILISYLFEQLPETMRQQVYLDKFWNALKQTYLLSDIHPAFRRAISAVMTTEIYTLGEIIYVQGQQKDFMVYVMRGNVQILSAEDGESPILTLGIGTCLGEANLVYGFPSPVQVIASSYCEIQRLSKQDFWRVALKYYKLNQTFKIHETMQKKMKDAIEVASEKNVSKATSDEDEVEVERALKIVKTKLKVEDPKSTSSFVCYTGNKHKSEIGLVETEYSRLYILSLHQTTLKHSDEICLYTSWPWALQPESVLLTIWEYFICACVLTVAVLYPYQISFSREFPHYMTLSMVIIDGAYLIDIVLQIFTAVEDENGIITKVSDIFTIRCKKFSFIIDVISILPFTTFADTFHVTKNKRLLTMFSINRLLKFHRVILLFRKLETSFHVNIAVVRCMKYVLYFLMLSYIMGAIFYMLACFNVICLPHSWYDAIKTEDEELGVLTRHQHYFALSIYYGALVISQTGFGDVTPKTMVEVCVTMIFFILGTLLFCYLIADFTATLLLAERQRENYIEMVTVINKFLISNNMLMNIQYRTNEYLALQWRINKGYVLLKEQSALFDVPVHLFEEQQIAKCFDILVNIPLFKKLDPEYIKKIAAEVKQIFLPPNEIVTYAGEVARNMYFIDRGFCEMISAASGKRENILGPTSHFCDFDMILGQPAIYHIQTVTHARIMKISYTAIKKVLVSAELYEELNQLANEIKTSLAVQRLFLRTETVSYQTMKEEYATSWFVFPKRKLNLHNIDYEKAFDVGVWRFCKAFLLRRTIIPDGKFLLIWEIIQAIRVFIMGIYYISLCFVSAYTLHAHYVWLLFDFVACVDLYIRMHVCYYNNKGILVTHPKYTALHYISGGFIIDFFSILPFPVILRVILGKTQQSRLHGLQNILRLNKLLQLYRITGVFSHFEMDILRTRSILLNIAKFLPISILFYNALTVILVTMTCNIEEDKAGYLIITPNETSWIGVEQDKRHFNVSVPINLYISGFYWVTITGLQVGYGNFKAWQKSEMYFIIIVVVAGYLFFTYILVLISSSKAAINVNLTLYQERMKHLISFMDREKVNKELQGTVIDHFEYIWQRTHGMKASNILNKCHLALRKDSVLYLYEQTFMQVPVFANMTRSFFRMLGMHVEEAYFLRYSSIIRLNDIINTIYIIHKGEATIKAPDGSTFATLTRGCMFGNMDNVRDSRSVTSVIASKAVDLLCINTEKLYKLADDYPVVISRIRKHILQENLSYIAKKGQREQMQIETEQLTKKTHSKKRSGMGQVKNVLVIGSNPSIMMLVSLMTCFVVMYHLAFQDHSILMFLIIYTFDFLHIIKIYTGFYMPYRNHMGEMVNDLQKIRKRYRTFTRFYLELVALIPFEVFCFAVAKDRRLYYLTWLRMNRMLSMLNIHHFFNVTFDRLNINVIIIKLGSVCIYFMLMIHVASCWLYMAACPAGKCRKDGWMFDDGKIRDNNHYLLSVYFVMATITSTGYGDVAPVTVSEMVLSIIIMLLGKFLMAIFIGDISAMVQCYSYSFVSYDYNMATLKDYLQRSYIVGPLIKRILIYVNHLWKKDRGLHLPVLLEESPSYLLEDVKAAAYGKHLFENYIFVSCHKDFLRQLIAKVKAQNFFQGDLICQHGDINNTMYFIHKGSVTVHIIDGHDEIQVEHLEELDCFGLVQGLFAFTPHTHTYKAETVSVILTLDLFDWVHLLRYYRAARHEIYSRIQRIAESY